MRVCVFVWATQFTDDCLKRQFDNKIWVDDGKKFTRFRLFIFEKLELLKRSIFHLRDSAADLNGMRGRIFAPLTDSKLKFDDLSRSFYMSTEIFIKDFLIFVWVVYCFFILFLVLVCIGSPSRFGFNGASLHFILWLFSFFFACILMMFFWILARRLFWKFGLEKRA